MAQYISVPTFDLTAHPYDGDCFINEATVTTQTWEVPELIQWETYSAPTGPRLIFYSRWGGNVNVHLLEVYGPLDEGAILDQMTEMVKNCYGVPEVVADAFRNTIKMFETGVGKNECASVQWKPPIVDVSRFARQLPGVESIVDYPCGCGLWSNRLFDVIIHLNDKEHWSREKIADWIDELHESGKINAEFSPWNGTAPNALDGSEDVGYISDAGFDLDKKEQK